MTISAVVPDIAFAGSSGSGTMGPFSLVKNGTPIVFYSNSEVVVLRYDTVTDTAPALLVEGADYTLTGGPSAGSITLTSPQTGLLTAERLYVTTVSALAQNLDLVNGGNFSSSNLERRLDIIFQVLQQHAREIKSSIRFAMFDTDEIPKTTPLDAVIGKIPYVTGTGSNPLVDFLDADVLGDLTELSDANLANIATVAADLSGADTIGIVAADLDGDNNIGAVASIADTLAFNIDEIVAVAGALNNGAGLRSYILQSSVSVVRLLADGNFSPSSVTFSAFEDDGTGERTAYAGLFRISTSIDGTSYTERYSSAANESSKVYMVPSGANFIRCQLFRANNFEEERQQFVVSVVRDGTDGSSGSGTDAVVVNLSKSSASVFAYADGTVPSFEGIDGQVTVFEGTANETASASFAIAGSGLTGQINTAADTPVSGKPKGYFRVTAMTDDIGALTITTTYGGVDYVRSFSVSKIRTGYEIVATLPSTNLFEGRLVFLTTDDKLYRYTGAAWTAAVAATDLTGQVVASQISDAAITTAKFAASIEPISLVSSLPGSKTTNSVFNTTDGFLYRWNGTAYVKAVPAADVTGTLTNAQIADLAATKITGTITETQIGTDAVTTAKIAAGSIVTAKLAANAVTANEIAANAVTAAKISSGAVTTAKLAAGAVTANEIAANTITAGQIASGAIATDELAAGAVTAVKIAAGTITADKITSNTITAGQIAAATITATQLATNAITADKISAGAVTAAKISVTSLAAMSASTGNLSVSGTLTLGGSGKLITSGTTYNTNGIFLGEDGAGVYKFSIGGTSGRLTFDGTNLSLPGGRLVDGSVGATKLSVSQLSAISADIGSITAGKLSLTSGSYVVRHGAGFGASSDLVLWYGLSSVAEASATKTNGVFALATDGKVYYGAAELTGGVEPISITRTNGFVKTRIGNGTNTTNSVSFSAIGGSGSYTFTHELAMGSTSGPTPSLSSSSGSPITVSATGVAGNEVYGTVITTATDGAGRKAQITSPLALLWEL